MSLKNFFSIMTLLGFFVAGTILMTGLLDRGFLLYYTGFMMLVAIGVYLISHSLIGEKSEKIVFFIALVIVFIAAAFAVSGFKDYSDAVQANNPTIQAQALQNDAVMEANLQKIAYANTLIQSLDGNINNSIALNQKMDTLINTNTDYLARLEQERIAKAQDDAILQALIDAQNNARNNFEDEFEDDD